MAYDLYLKFMYRMCRDVSPEYSITIPRKFHNYCSTTNLLDECLNSFHSLRMVKYLNAINTAMIYDTIIIIIIKLN